MSLDSSVDGLFGFRGGGMCLIYMLFVLHALFFIA
jgi:hypothetical protein